MGGIGLSVSLKGACVELEMFTAKDLSSVLKLLAVKMFQGSFIEKKINARNLYPGAQGKRSC